MMLSEVWSQLCVKADISFPQRIPRLTDRDKVLVPLSRCRPPNRDCYPSLNNHPISPCKIGTKCGRLWYSIVGRSTAISITSPPSAGTATLSNFSPDASVWQNSRTSVGPISALQVNFVHLNLRPAAYQLAFRNRRGGLRRGCRCGRAGGR